MNCLAIDLGTHCGFAYNRGEEFFAGTWHLMSAKEVAAQAKVRGNRRKDARVERLCKLVGDLGHFDVILFEDCHFSTTTYACQMWAGLRSALWLCGQADLFEAVPVSTLKKYATSCGAADKAAMGAALRRQHPALWRAGYSDDTIDAIWLWQWAQTNLSRAA